MMNYEIKYSCELSNKTSIVNIKVVLEMLEVLSMIPGNICCKAKPQFQLSQN